MLSLIEHDKGKTTCIISNAKRHELTSKKLKTQNNTKSHKRWYCKIKDQHAQRISIIEKSKPDLETITNELETINNDYPTARATSRKIKIH